MSRRCSASENRVFHRQLRARTDRVVCRVSGVAHQHDVAARPAGVLDGRETTPDRTICHQAVSAKTLGEQPLAVLDRSRLVVVGKARRPQGLFGCLDDEGREFAVVLVGMQPPETVFVVAEVEGEGRERARRTEPHEAVGPPVDARLEGVGESVAHRAVGAVGTNNEVGGSQQLAADVVVRIVQRSVESIDFNLELSVPPRARERARRGSSAAAPATVQRTRGPWTQAPDRGSGMLMSSQWKKASRIAAQLSGSASVRLPIVASEKTTPKPKVSSSRCVRER